MRQLMPWLIAINSHWQNHRSLINRNMLILMYIFFGTTCAFIKIKFLKYIWKRMGIF